MKIILSFEDYFKNIVFRMEYFLNNNYIIEEDSGYYFL